VFVLILLGAITFMGGFVFWSTVGFMDRQTNTVIETDIEGLADVYQRDGLNGLIATIESRIKRDPSRSSIYLVANHRKVPVVGNISGWPNARPDQDGWIEFRLREKSSSDTTQARTRPFLLKGGINLLVGRDIRTLDEMKRLIERSLGWSMAIAMVVGVSAGLLFTRKVGRRLDIISRTSRRVRHGNLSERVPLTGSGDDLDELALGLNTMLDEIQQLLSGIEYVADNLAHDLRTPLSRLHNRLMRLRSETEQEGLDTISIDTCLSEVDQILATFSALLRISKLEAAGQSKALSPVNLRQLMDAAIELYEPLAREHGIVIATELEEISVPGDRDLLLQAVCNLLDNAIKFSLHGGRIDIDLRDELGQTNLRISDHGVGIDHHDRDRVFERLYRGQVATDIDGLGLGLTLVKAILQYHAATVSLHDNYPGLRVLIEFDKARDDEIISS
jgi:signal transduction histidine kinase